MDKYSDKNNSTSPSEVTLFRHPLITVSTLAEVLLIKLKQLLILSRQYWYIILISAAVIAATYLFSSLHFLRSIGYFCFYWIILGVASSIGLGTGLHTFVLYLGPHIAKVAMTATECGYIPEMVPSRWQFDHFRECTTALNGQEISFFTILFAVQLESFLWGFGTAIGELPPYFIARHAAQAADRLKEAEREEENNMLRDTPKLPNFSPQKPSEQEITKMELEVEQAQEQLEELKEIEQLQHQDKSKMKLIDRAKLFLYQMLQKYGFITVLLCASIPNPLFDLAGITCGHFKIPFKTFFGATFIGKAIIKVHIQMIFIITLFRKDTVELVLKKIQNWFPSLQNTLIQGLGKQKKLLFTPETFQENKPLLAKVWDIVLISMILYFLMSIINTSVQHRLVEKKLKKTIMLKHGRRE